MKKIKQDPLSVVFLTVVIIFSLVSIVGKSAIAKAEQNQERNQGQNEEAVCDNQCGDKTCQEVVCLAIDCPCAETKENCPQDCQVKNKTKAEEHRNAVANFVQGLLNVADREEGGIGQQVRVIAQQQNDSKNTTTQAIEKVEKRNKIKTFLFGSDYKNLGALRNEIVKTRNRLEQLNRLMENVTSEGDRTELQNQIQALEQEQTKIDNFIKAQDGKFNLFGWLLKLFNK
jgi:hypothetical protein